MLRPKVKKQRTKYNPEEEKRLANLVFATGGDIVETLLKNDVENEEELNKSESEEENEEVASDSESELIESNDEEEINDVDSDNISNENDDDDDDEEQEENEESFDDKSDLEEDIKNNKRKAVWIDEDDENQTVNDALKIQGRTLPHDQPDIKYNEYVKEKFEKIYGTPKWAKNQNVDEENDDQKILKQSNHLAVSKLNKLKPGNIDLKAMRNINYETGYEGPEITSLQFHPKSTVAFVAGISKKLSVFKIDGKENTKLASIIFDNYPIASARFLKEGNEIIIGSRFHNYSQTYDLITGSIYQTPLPHKVTNMQNFEVSPNGKYIAIAGKRGEIHLLNGITRELICELKMNKTCFSLAFTPDSNILFSHGDGNEIYTWDLKQRECINKSIDDGCLKSKAIAVSPNGQFFASGSNQGIVNIYDMKSVMETSIPQPLKIVKNLVTPISCVKFNSTSEILAIASKEIKNGFKMVHIPSFTVFSNFPSHNTVMNKPLAIDFSPASGYLGVTNNDNKAYLYRLKHFKNY